MLSRLFLAAGVAALAIAAPASAEKGGKGGGGGPKAEQPRGGGGGQGRGGGAPAVSGSENRGHGGGGAVFMGGGGGRGRGGGFTAPQMRAERQQARGFERQQTRGAERQRGFERQEARAIERQRGYERQQARAAERQRGFERQQARAAERQRGFERQQARALERQQRTVANQRELALERREAEHRMASREQFRDERFERLQQRWVANEGESVFSRGGGRGLIDGCPPGLWMKNNGCMPPGQAAKLLGAPLATAAAIVPLSVLPQPLSYFYPDTDDYYWRYGNGYLYRVDRDSALIQSLLPLIGGGYVPGTYLPSSYMSSYVPNYWGLNSFYPDYGGVCNRYEYGVIYQVDCATGFVENVIPMYAGGYGVGQMLPSAYSYYNVPMQYRDLYYDTTNYGYWYAPGAIYQYDPQTSLITSVAALLSPGFTLGQRLPMGYDVYNVPYGYRDTYYDTPNAWYRYNNGYIYQVDPVTQIVTAIVASLLT